MHAFDMSEYEKVIGVSDGRITGNFVALVPTTRDGKDRRIWITALDVTIWDEDRRCGRCFYSNDMKGSVLNGVAEISKRMIAPDRLADAEEVWDELLAVFVAVAEATVPSTTEQEQP